MLRSILFFFLKISLITGIIGVVLTTALLYYYAQDLPDYSQLAHYHPPAVTRIYSADGKLVEEYAKEHRVFVPISTIPPSLIEAFIAAEDKNFYDHPGIDFIGIIRAAGANVVNLLQHRRMEGASTITQQVVKNFLLSSERSMERKIKEAILSYMISKTFSKSQILELYLNQMYLGHGAYGVAAAAEVYFNKSVEELTLAESAFLAALPKAPSSVNPEKNHDRAKARRNYVLLRMVEDRYINSAAAREAMDSPITLVKRSKAITVTAGYYAEKVREEIITKFGEDFFYNGGLTVITSMNSEYQVEAEKSLRKGIRQFDLKKGYRGPVARIDVANWKAALSEVKKPLALLEYQLAVILEVENTKASIGLIDGTKSSIPLTEMVWGATNLKSAKTILKKGDVVVVEPVGKAYGLRQVPVVNGAIMIMSQHTGQVLAMVGGYDFGASKFDRATQAIRQPGSSIKTFVYLAALESGVSPGTIFADAPIAVSQGAGMPIWRPKNFNGDFLGDITMSDGLVKSRNPVTVRVTQMIGLHTVAEIIRRFGINNNPKHVYSMVLGSLETTLDKILSAYAAIANGGQEIRPEFIELIKDSSGKVIYQRNAGRCINCHSESLPQISEPERKKLISDAVAYQINLMLQGVMERGTGKSALKLGKILAGKTGTTNLGMDTWFFGYTPNIIVGTYVGFDTPKSLGKTASGANVTLPIFIDFMANAMKDVPSIPFNFNSEAKIIPIRINDGLGHDQGYIEPHSNIDDVFDHIAPQKSIITPEKNSELY
ncbi:MAG: penicillin-binding protein 1A [Pseudomonadota bacterium]